VVSDVATLKVRRAERYLCLSPTTTQYETMGHRSLIAISIGSGATFSPPLVIISSFILPERTRFPSTSSR